jgi:hypothetical protein
VKKLILLSLSLLTFAQEPLKPRTPPPTPAWDRFYPNAEIINFLQGYAKSYPEWVKLESIGKGSAGGDMWMVTITNPKTGADTTKPAVYIDAATHANEIQGTEVCLYAMDFVLKNYGKLPRVTEFLDRGTLYVLPMVNVDARDKWFKEPATPNFPRTVIVSIDDDRDGRKDEDGFDDLNGDGEITMMRKRVPKGQGRMTLDLKDARLTTSPETGELGDYLMLGYEGIDNDGDGNLNEDPYGYIDPNRAFGYGWKPRYVQAGSTEYPLQIAEARNIALWAMKHENVNSVVSFHNFGKYILRGPGAKNDKPFLPADVRVLDLLGKEGEKILPGYRYGESWKLLYDSYGDTTDHFFGRHGAYSFVNELYGAPGDTDKDGKVSPAEALAFNDNITQGRMFVEWKKFDHPQYGEIEIGGYRHDTGRPPEGFLHLEECHRNTMFVLFNAFHLPHLRVEEPTVKRLDGNLWRIHVPVLNDRGIPSMAAVVTQNKLHRADVASVEGGRVVAAGIVRDELNNRIDFQDKRPERLMVNGVEGFSTTKLCFLVEGSGEVTFRYDSVKAGVVTRKIVLQ